MNLIETIFSPLSLPIAVAAWGLTQLAKLLIELQLAEVRTDARTAKRSGADARKLRPVITHVVLPFLPLLFGLLLGLFAYEIAPRDELSNRASHALWGMLVGLMTEFAYSRVHGLKVAVRDNRAG